MQENQSTPASPIVPQPRWSVGWGGWVLGSITAILTADLAVRGFDSKNPMAAFQVIFWTAATMAYMHVRFGRSGWLGFGKGLLVGTAVTVIFIFGHGFVADYLKDKGDRRLVSRFYSAAAAFEPALQIAVRDIEKTGKYHLSTPAAQEHLRAALQTAEDLASDRTLVDYAQAQQNIVDPRKGGTAADCAALARGGAGNLAKVNPRAWMIAVTGLLEGARSAPRRIVALDSQKYRGLLGRILSDVDPENIFGDEEKLAAQADDALCNRYLAFTKRIYALPAEDAAGVLRYLKQKSATAAPPTDVR